MLTNKTLKFLSATLSALIFSISLPVFASKIYADIPPGFWAENPADIMAEFEIMQGVSSTEFGGNMPVNRYDLARIISALLGNKSLVGIILLSDVRQGNPDFKAIMKVLNAQIMEPQNNKFSGEKKVTRYEFALHIMKTLDYLQAEPISIRQSPKIIDAPKDKKALLDKAVNRWQLTDGYTDWAVTISRYEALEMTAKAAVIINSELKVKLGEFGRNISPVIPTPYSTPVIPVIPTPYSTPVIPVMPTPYPTPVIPVIPTPYSTPVIPVMPTPYSTPVIPVMPTPYSTPVIPVMPTPIMPVVPTPVVPTPIATPILPVPTSVAPPVNTNSEILKNNVSFRGFYNFYYSENIPDKIFPVEGDKDRKFTDLLGPAVVVDASYWLKDLPSDIPLKDIAKDSGFLFGVSSLGSYLYPLPVPDKNIKSDTEISETFRGYVTGLYKVIKSSDTEVAVGPDLYYRVTSSSSSKTTVNSYWRASKNYFGIGAKTLVGYKLTNEFKFETNLGIHYVSQMLNEKINYGDKPQVVDPIDRFDIDLAINGKYDVFKYENYMIYGDGGFWLRMLVGEGTQTIAGAGVGIGVTY